MDEFRNLSCRYNRLQDVPKFKFQSVYFASKRVEKLWQKIQGVTNIVTRTISTREKLQFPSLLSHLDSSNFYLSLEAKIYNTRLFNIYWLQSICWIRISTRRTNFLVFKVSRPWLFNFPLMEYLFIISSSKNLQHKNF